MLTPHSPKTGLYWPPVVARVGRRPWRCRCGLLYWWPPVLAAAVGRPPWWRPSVWLAGVLAGGPCRWCPSAVLAVGPWLVSVRGRGGRFRGRWRPFGRPSVRWVAVVLSWPVAARVGLVCLPCQSAVFPPPLASVAAGVRCWCLRALCTPSVVAVAVSLAVLAGFAGVGVIAPCRGPWPVSLAASMGRRVAVCWWCHCAVPCWVVCRVRPSVLVSAVAVAGRPSVLAGLLVCGRWLASVSCRVPCPWWPVWAVGGVGVRRWSLRPVWALFWALPTGWPCGPCQWLAAVAGGACACGGACLFQRTAARGWLAVGRVRCFRGGGVRLPCLWWSLLVSHQRRPWPPV